MIDEFLRRFAQCGSRKCRFSVRKWADERMTPLEMAALRERVHDLPPDLRPWLSRFENLPKARATVPQAYRAQEVAPGICLYTGERSPAERKALILAFSGGALLLLVPIAFLLQFIPSSRFDIVVLQDSGLAHYARGIPPYAHSFPALLRGLDVDLGFSAYEALYTCGSSMGGFPALRAGILTNARRAVSLGGRLAWHVRRLQGDGGSVLPAFDPLCECMRRKDTDLVCVYGADHEVDRDHAERLSRAYPARRLPIRGVGSHNTIFELAKAGRLQGFLDAMFDIPGGQPEAEFLADDLEKAG